MTRRLRRAGYEEREIADTCDQLESVGYMNDSAFAQSLMRRRAQQGRGARVIAAELRQKGVEPAIIDELLADRDQDAEQDRASELAAKLVERKSSESPAKMRDHVLGALVRRGYPHVVAREALNRALKGDLVT